MNTKEGTDGMMSTQTRLSTLWVFIMFNMVFADILSFMYPGFLKEVMAGRAGGVQITPGFLLMAAVLTEVPIAMIVLSRVLKQRSESVGEHRGRCDHHRVRRRWLIVLPAWHLLHRCPGVVRTADHLVRVEVA